MTVLDPEEIFKPAPADTLVTVPTVKVPKLPLPNTTCEAVPAPVTAIVPELVTGESATLNAEGIDNPTLVTVPEVFVNGKLDIKNFFVELSVESTPAIKSAATGVAAVNSLRSNANEVEAPNATDPPPDKPSPAVTVTAEFDNLAFAIEPAR